ncbi:MAG: hypothetical protein K1060chlam3_00189 [Candidatus Anoxychlamydiales bacterium]|nr:hypothetical protein [Candidatus Anoxychlamydiales bacterium]
MRFLKFLLLFLVILQIKPIKSKADVMKAQDENLKKQTLVCVHGFFRTKLNMYFIEKSLKKENFEVYNWRYKSRDKYINEHAQDLVKELIEIAKKKPNEPINFVTHSMGGLVLRSAINHRECPIEAKMGKAILIAAPNKGSVVAQKLSSSRLARLFFKNKAGSELMEKKDFDDLGVFSPDMSVLQIVGTLGISPWINEKNDGKVAVSETKLDGIYKQIDVKASHSWICYSPTVIRHLKEFLAE